MDLSPHLLRDIPRTISFHYKNGNLNYPMIIYISLVHIVAVAGLFTVHKCMKETLFWAFILWPIRYVYASCSLRWKSLTRLCLVALVLL